LALALLLCISVWSLVDDPMRACGTCGTVQRQIPAGLFGTIVYGGLLVASLAKRAVKWVGWGVCAAFAGHAFLMTQLLLQSQWCARCGVAAALAGVAVLLALHVSRIHPLRAALVTCALLGALQIGAPYLLPFQPRSRALALVGESDLDTQGQAVTLVVFEREGALGAVEFRRSYEPLLVREFGSRLRVVYRKHREPEILEPTVVVARTKADAVVVSGPRDYSAFRGRILNRLRAS
jgi:hypothetical protein